MKAIVIVPGGKGGTLELREVPEPRPQPGQLLIRVRATALNRADLYQRQGAYPTSATGNAPTPTIAGLEAAGEVAGWGEGVKDFTIGDRVMTRCVGGYAGRSMAASAHRGAQVGRQSAPLAVIVITCGRCGSGRLGTPARSAR
jgi:NADPH:quinone reductase-like Zn-dependent oxidoreductase